MLLLLVVVVVDDGWDGDDAVLWNAEVGDGEDERPDEAEGEEEGLDFILDKKGGVEDGAVEGEVVGWEVDDGCICIWGCSWE